MTPSRPEALPVVDSGPPPATVLDRLRFGSIAPPNGPGRRPTTLRSRRATGVGWARCARVDPRRDELPKSCEDAGEVADSRGRPPESGVLLR